MSVAEPHQPARLEAAARRGVPWTWPRPPDTQASVWYRHPHPGTFAFNTWYQISLNVRHCPQPRQPALRADNYPGNLTFPGMHDLRSECRNLQVLYDELVMPARPIVDYNTQFSGIDMYMMVNVKTSIQDVQVLSMNTDNFQRTHATRPNFLTRFESELTLLTALSKSLHVNLWTNPSDRSTFNSSM